MPPDDDNSLHAARAMLELHFAERVLVRIDHLTAKARDGELTSDEETELDGYRRAGDLLEEMKSRARQRLRDAGENL